MTDRARDLEGGEFVDVRGTSVRPLVANSPVCSRASQPLSPRSPANSHGCTLPSSDDANDQDRCLAVVGFVMQSIRSVQEYWLARMASIAIGEWQPALELDHPGSNRRRRLQT